MILRRWKWVGNPLEDIRRFAYYYIFCGKPDLYSRVRENQPHPSILPEFGG